MAKGAVGDWVDFPHKGFNNAECSSTPCLLHIVKFVRGVAVILGDIFINMHWKSRVVMMPTLSLLLAPHVVITTSYDATSGDKVGIMTNLDFHFVVTGGLQVVIIRTTCCAASGDKVGTMTTLDFLCVLSLTCQLLAFAVYFNFANREEIRLRDVDINIPTDYICLAIHGDDFSGFGFRGVLST